MKRNLLLSIFLVASLVCFIGARTLVNLAQDVTNILPIANGGTGTSSPAITPGTNITTSGTWPNITINATNSGGGSTIGSGLPALPNQIPFFGNTVPGQAGASGTGTTLASNGVVYQNSLSVPIFLEWVSGSGQTNIFNSDSTGAPSTPVWNNLDGTVGGAVNHGYVFVPSGLNYDQVGTASPLASGSGEYYELPNLSDSGDLVASRAIGTSYQNSSSNLMFVVVQFSGVADSVMRQGYSDASNPPTTLKWQNMQNQTGAGSIMIVVLPSHYYKFACSGCTLTHLHEYQVNIASSISSNLTATRAYGTQYQNTGTKEILVIASASFSGTGTSQCLSGAVSGTLFGKDGQSSQSSTRDTTMICIIHPNFYYKMNRDAGTPTLTFWYEITLG